MIKSLPGIRLEEELPGSGPCGRVFRAFDCRRSSGSPERRVVRILADELDDACRESLMDRIAALARLELPYVAAPPEPIVVEEAVWLVDVERSNPLSQRIRPDRGLELDAAAQLAEQLLVGLAALHRHGLAHGDLRHGNVFLSSAADLGRGGPNLGEVMIVDAALGELRFQSGGQLGADTAGRYEPPEWSEPSAQRVPSPRADLYALGVLLAEAILGEQAVLRAVRQQPAERLSSLLRSCDRRLGGMLGRPGAMVRFGRLRWLLRHLLADSHRRPRSAVETLDAWRKWPRRRSCVILGACVTVTLLACMGWRAARRQLAPALVELAATQDQLREKSESLDAVIKQLAALDTSIPPSSIPADENARSKWRGQVSHEPPGKRIPKAAELYESLSLPNSNDADAIGRWLDLCQRRRAEADAWLGANDDDALRSCFNALTAAPWAPNVADDFDRRLNLLRTAAEIWSQWAAGTLQFEKLDQQALGQDQPVRDVLNRWLAEISAGKQSQWTVSLANGASPDGYGTIRRVSVHGGEWALGNLHNWSSSKGNTYGKNNTLGFGWEPGAPITIGLEGPRSIPRGGYRPYVLYETVGGPLALWRLNQLGRVANPDGFSLTFSIPGCPGPPRGWRGPPPPTIVTKPAAK